MHDRESKKVLRERAVKNPSALKSLRRIPRTTGQKLGLRPEDSFCHPSRQACGKDSRFSLPPLLQRRDHLFAGAIGGRIYAVGGRARPNLTLQIVEEFNPATRTWGERAPMPSGRSGGATAVINNRLYVFGGEGNDDNPLGTFNQVEFYDAARNAWTKLAPMPLPRHALGAAVVGKRIYLPGGSIVQGGRGPGVTAIMDTFEPN